jgi:hypothetical protein
LSFFSTEFQENKAVSTCMNDTTHDTTLALLLSGNPLKKNEMKSLDFLKIDLIKTIDWHAPERKSALRIV